MHSDPALRDHLSENLSKTALSELSVASSSIPLDSLTSTEQATADEVAQTVKQAYGYLFLHHALPFTAFGFTDNFIMILFGDCIDSTIGVSLGLTTLAAAGIGNLVSDVMGLGTGAIIESMAIKMGLPEHDLTLEQTRSTTALYVKMLGMGFGITIGCLLGLCPLLVLNPRHHGDPHVPLDTPDPAANLPTES